MTTLNCICRPSTLVLNQFQTFQCFSCGIFAHMSCYEYSPTEITKLFCIKCRLKILEPFYEFLEFLIPPVLLPKNKQINEIFKFFLDKSALKTSILGIICTKIVFPENNNFLYEWPSENITLSLNKTFLKYQMSSYLTITDEKIIYMNNSLEIDYKEILKDSSVFGVCLLEKKDYKTVAKEIAQMNQLTAEEARKNFEKLKIKDVEVNNQFPIKDPLTFNMIVLPARGTLCLHPACFDLLSFLQININGSKFRWKCPICKQSLKIIDIVIDSHLHKILKTLKRDYNGKEGELEKIEYICFDEEGNWKAKQNFSEEWDKRNKLFSKTKHPRNLESKHDSNLIKCQFQSSNNDYNQINPQKTQLSSKTKNDISNEKPHITLIDLLKIYNEDQNFDTNEPEASIFEKFKQNSYLANVPIDIFFQFLEKTNLLNYSRIERLTIFEKYNENKEHEPLETIAETLLKESDFKLVVWFISLWAKSLQDILKITFLIINRNNENDFKMAMEIFLMIGHLNLKKKVQCLEIRNYSLFASFGCFLGKFFQALGMELEIYGKTMFYFSRFLPDLHFPIGISKSRCREYYEKLSDFILTFLAQLDFKNFVKFFCEIHQPPQDEIASFDDERLILNFIYYFVLVLRKKNPLITGEAITEIINEWDKYNCMKNYIRKEKIDIMRINLELFF